MMVLYIYVTISFQFVFLQFPEIKINPLLYTSSHPHPRNDPFLIQLYIKYNI